MSAMLSCPDRQLLLHIVRKMPSVLSMNKRQETMIGNWRLNVWKVVESGPAAFIRLRPIPAIPRVLARTAMRPHRDVTLTTNIS
jgi:hypothetical protein